MASRTLRAVVVARPTDYELLIATHGTRGQAEFFLRARGRELACVEEDHALMQASLALVLGQIPPRWRRATVGRGELSRFLFEPEDIIIAVGQDGLVANVAKYLTGQLVVGINPLLDRYQGPLARHPVKSAADLLGAIDSERVRAVEERTMAQAKLDDGQTLIALNEIFIGHRSHQSARYEIRLGDASEHQSSSGLICSTGTGSTGWASSINRAVASKLHLPDCTDPQLCFFVREAWPSRATGASIINGTLVRGSALTITSEMNAGGVIFGDGIEDDFLAFDWGRIVEVGVASQRLRLLA